MVVKCYINIKGDSDWSKNINTLEISCSEQMADYLTSQTNEKNIFQPEKEHKKTIKEITDTTLDVGDKVISDNIRLYSDFYFERKDYDFCYEKTVNRVEDRMVYMTARNGKQFAVKMNDWLYLKDKPKRKDKVLVTKFNDGKTLVTEITERYVPPSQYDNLVTELLHLSNWEESNHPIGETEEGIRKWKLFQQEMITECELKIKEYKKGLSDDEIIKAEKQAKEELQEWEDLFGGY